MQSNNDIEAIRAYLNENKQDEQDYSQLLKDIITYDRRQKEDAERSKERSEYDANKPKKRLAEDQINQLTRRRYYKILRETRATEDQKRTEDRTIYHQ